AVAAASSVWYYMYFHDEKDVGRMRFALAPVQSSLLPSSKDKDPNKDKDFDAYRAAQLGLVKSAPVCMAALRSPGVAALTLVREQARPVEWLSSSIDGSFPAPDVLEISFSSADRPEELELLLKAYRDAFYDEALSSEDRWRRDQVDRL